MEDQPAVDAAVLPAVPSPVPTSGSSRRVVLALGAPGSGTGVLADVLNRLGLPSPRAEAVDEPADARDAGDPGAAADAEPWASALHTELLRRSNVDAADARPSAWFDAGRLAGFEPLRTRVHTWLEGQLAAQPELVVADPRLAWFAGLWRSAALRCEARPGYVMILRPPREVVGSRGGRWLGTRLGAPPAVDGVQRTAAWLNLVLHAERATRGFERGFVRYDDLLSDWTVPIHRLARRLDVASVQEASTNDVRAVHALLDPDRRHRGPSWDDLAVPAHLRELAEAAQAELDQLVELELADPDPADSSAHSEADPPAAAAVHAALDEVRAAYVERYEAAEVLTRSSAQAARREGLRARPKPPARRGVDVVPHRVRAMVPPAARRGVRRALGRARPEEG